MLQRYLCYCNIDEFAAAAAAVVAFDRANSAKMANFMLLALKVRDTKNTPDSLPCALTHTRMHTTFYG